MAAIPEEAKDLNGLANEVQCIPLTYTTRSGDIYTTLKRLKPQPSFYLSETKNAPQAGIVLVGYSTNGRRNLKNIYNNQGCNVRYIVEDEPELVEHAKQDIQELEIEDCVIVPYAQLQKAIESRETRFVLVSAPTHMRKGVVSSSLQAGKDVMCDKPLASSSEDARELFALARRQKKVLITDLPGRPGKAFSPIIMALIATASKIVIERIPEPDSPIPSEAAFDPADTEVEEMLLSVANHDAFAINFCMCMRPSIIQTTPVEGKPGTLEVKMTYPNKTVVVVYCNRAHDKTWNQSFVLTGERLSEMRRVDHMKAHTELSKVKEASADGPCMEFRQVYDGAAKDALEQMYTASSGRLELASRVRPGLMEQNVVDCLQIARAAIESLRGGSAQVDVVYW
eukprot:CAMPEP_0202821412 /NCGR_PEP_ID=MMETSP1389-20130828/10355_1 /ASSEMBLY_ACC=CAM_ASM_000865 /TAXON_ID=302021 /ORGANISM="Rhodomonas sp., Strain CCMP768" /LENGTH=396 /DNA_ID=CAMNT_0049494171 /DNA_START=1 /DNA_END=1191 /DNA_ORIENTATION=+